MNECRFSSEARCLLSVRGQGCVMVGREGECALRIAYGDMADRVMAASCARAEAAEAVVRELVAADRRLSGLVQRYRAGSTKSVTDLDAADAVDQSDAALAHAAALNLPEPEEE